LIAPRTGRGYQPAMFRNACPGRSAARSGALQTRDLQKLLVRDDPRSAV
jgi:hypothetical protein